MSTGIYINIIIFIIGLYLFKSVKIRLGTTNTGNANPWNTLKLPVFGWLLLLATQTVPYLGSVASYIIFYFFGYELNKYQYTYKCRNKYTEIINKTFYKLYKVITSRMGEIMKILFVKI